MVRHHTPSLSFEVFPPNPAVGNEKIIQALREMQDIAPHYISVTASNNKFNIELGLFFHCLLLDWEEILQMRD